MKRRRSQAPERTSHPDPAIELQLQRIISRQRAVARYELLIADYRTQMDSASDEQDCHSSRLRSGNQDDHARASYQLGMDQETRRMEFARTGITEAEQAIETQHEEIAKLAAAMSATDLSYLS